VITHTTKNNMLKDISLDEINNLPDDLKVFYFKALLQNQGYYVLIGSSEFRKIKTKYPNYFIKPE